MDKERNCGNCKHNYYLPNTVDWVACGHPTTIRKQPKPEPGDPQWVNQMTSDRRLAEIAYFDDCEAFEPVNIGE